VPIDPPSADNADAARDIAALLSRVALGDRTAFARLYERTSAHLLGQILRINRNRAASEDVLQEVYINVWRAAGGFDPRLSQPMTWLASIARNRAIDSLRRAQARPATVSTQAGGIDGDDEHDLLQDFASGDAGPLELLERSADAQALRHCVGGLSAEQQQSVALAFYQGLSYAEVAQHLAQPLGTVKSWVRRGLQSLKSCLERAAAGA
jgi:RNA polymerase sigma factor (sigma-70 family)